MQRIKRFWPTRNTYQSTWWLYHNNSESLLLVPLAVWSVEQCAFAKKSLHRRKGPLRLHHSASLGRIHHDWAFLLKLVVFVYDILPPGSAPIPVVQWPIDFPTIGRDTRRSRSRLRLLFFD